MESEHTPGPWHAYNRGIGWEVHEGASCREGFCLCGPVNSGTKGPSGGQIERGKDIERCAHKQGRVAPKIPRFEQGVEVSE